MFLLGLLFAQTTPPPEPTPQEIVKPQEVRPLAGQLNSVPVFNSNSPEVVLSEGILLSTFAKENKANPEAHLSFPFQGRFDIFAHHIAKPPTPEDLRTLYLGIMLHNPTKETVTVDILAAASYLSRPDAPFIKLPSQVPNPEGNVYAGPGSRVMNDILRGVRQENFPDELVIPPGESRMLLNLPIPVREWEPPLNGRSTYIKLDSNGEVYAASLAMFAPVDERGEERKPTLAEWKELLAEGELVTPRDRVPTPPNNTTGGIIYGRVAGVSQGSQWKATLTDNNRSEKLTIPGVGEAFSYGISTLAGGRLGTNQIQTAPMLVRYPDTAYSAHGNYGVEYSLTLPFYNPTEASKTVAVTLQTPIKQDILTQGLRFLEPPAPQVFFRGTVEISYEDEQGNSVNNYFHLVQQRGQQAEPLANLTIPPKETRTVKVDFLYPPDATPPQVLTVKTLTE
ncbi:DUF3370 domain-containing protein [Oscillatoria salina]|uniref:DUF3370 domain-containing protein n=1 Tax=Oscillatoria salina TaxID=331517 RepID=UPI001CCC57B8|nr:DUF3370 domain-containing protein [Oscillatoria salina]MBZ8179134.1 DUF3370 domain-containing protein [Oscillatoria salina IIICB1]